jgi:hypothetical protein
MVKLDIVLYSNCAGRIITNMFKKHIYTNDKFTINHITNYVNLNKKLDISHIQILKNCDVFVYQPFNQDYTYSEYDISNMKKYLKPECIILKLNYYRFKGFWFESTYEPYISYNNYHFHSDIKHYGLHNSFTNFNGNKKDIIDKINNISIDKEKFFSYFREELDNFKKIDDNSDIKMYDFFINNYKRLRLFNDPFHPTNIFFYEIFRQLVFNLTGHLLVSEDTEFINLLNDSELTHWSLPILPIIRKFLDIETSEIICVFYPPENGDKKLYINIYDYYYIRLSKINFQNYLNGL